MHYRCTTAPPWLSYLPANQFTKTLSVFPALRLDPTFCHSCQFVNVLLQSFKTLFCHRFDEASWHTTAVQPEATCRQSPYLLKPSTVIVTSFSLWRLAPTTLAAPVFIMTTFSLWHHSRLSWPRPPLRTYEHTYVPTDTLPRWIYKSVVNSQRTN